MIPVVLSPETAYATKPNIVFPGSSAQATVAEGLAEDRMNDALSAHGLDGLTITVAAGAIEVANP